MKHSIVLKFIAILLAACALTVALGSAFGVILLAQAGLYTTDYETWTEQFYLARSEALGTAMAESYAARSLSNCSEQELQYISRGNTPETIGDWWSVDAAFWRYQVADFDGRVLESNYNYSSEFAGAKCYTLKTSVRYPMKVAQYADWDESISYYTSDNSRTEIYLRYVQSPEYTVTVWMLPDSITEFSGVRVDVYEVLAHFRYHFIAGLAGGLLLTAAFLVYLFCAAGKHRAGELPAPGGLNRVPLDIYAAAAGLACFGAAFVTIEIVEEFLYFSSGLDVGWMAVAVLTVFLAALCVVGFLFALAAQWKMHGFYAWRHSVTGWCCGKLWGGIRFLGRILYKLYELLPLIGRYLLIGLAMGILPLWFFYLAAVGRSYWVFFLFMACICDTAIICYGAYAYGTLLKGAKQMAEGNLSSNIDTKYLVGSYKTCAEHLNALADVAVVAAKNQMKSDRMKTELITNVSHDIKTPLTSIINYIDLLQKAEKGEQTEQYLQVLDRQSQRLKKLIEDLMEMSKATTGNMAVEIVKMDAAEAVKQALGEFSDKLAAQELTVVFRQPERVVPIRADGRLTWRVLSNLLSNVVKYALPGTRVYADICQLDGQVTVSLKNISREELNVSTDELTERFVRGDASRNTEGSGLGLNIAKSLMELQKGQLQLLVDGDLFKVTLTFPSAE